MRKQSPSFPLVIIVAVFAVALTLLYSGANAAPAPQDSPLLPTETPTATVTPFGTAEVGAPTTFPEPGRPEPEQPLPDETFTPLEPPTSVPLPTSALPTPTVSGFLPAPTITNPDDIDSIPLAQPQVGGGGNDEPIASPTPARSRNPVLVAGVAILNVLWLICGSALVIGGVAYMIILARRKSDS